MQISGFCICPHIVPSLVIDSTTVITLDFGCRRLASLKSAYPVELKDFQHIIDFQNRSANDVTGLVFYHGEKVAAFGETLFAMPLVSLLSYSESWSFFCHAIFR